MFTLRHTPIALALLSLYSASSFATERMNINITKGLTTLIVDEDSRTETGTAITVFTEEYIEEKQAKTVAEVLQDAPGVSISSTGGMGQQTSVFIRGAASNNTVVIIDGVKVTDQSSSSGGFDFANLTTDSIERIEVIRGSQSALWGSDALGGVINITTKKGKEGFNSSANMEFGANNYAKQSVNINGASKRAHYSLSASNISTDGDSVKTGDDDDPDNDGYTNRLITMKGGYQFTPIFSVDAVARYSDSKSEYDATSSYSPYDETADNDVYSTETTNLAKINAHLNLLDNRWKNRLSFSYSDTTSETFDPNGYYGSYSENSGDTYKGEIQSDYLVTTGNSQHRFTVAGEVQKDTYLAWSVEDEQKMDSSAVIGEYNLDWNSKIFTTISARHDFNSEFDDTSTYKLALSAWATKTIRLHTTHGTGVKNPTFSQLFGAYATPDLDPETSVSTDVGVEYNFANNSGYIDLTFFDAQYDDAIRYNSSTWAYENQDEKVQGIELSSFVKVSKDFNISGQYTYLETEDGTDEKLELLRRPKHSASISNSYQFNEDLNFNLGVNYVGERYDYGYIELDEYFVVNLAANYQVTDRFAIYGRIDNVLDKDYVVVTDYNTDPFTAYVGVSFK